MTRKSLFKKICFAVIAAAVFTLFAAGSASALRDSQIPNLDKIREMITGYRESGDWGREIDAVGAKGVAIIDAECDKKARQAIVFDIDETTIDNYEFFSEGDFASEQNKWREWVQSGKAPAIAGIKRIYDEAVAKGVRVFFITGRGERSREATERNLKAAGYAKYERLVMRKGDEGKLTALDYKSAKRARIEKEGFRIILNVGDQYSDLLGGHSKNTLKVPNPMYFIP